MKNKLRYSFDYSKLKGRMKEKDYTQKMGAEDINVSKSTFNLRINNKGVFDQCEILTLKKKLDILDDELVEYFFNEKV